MRWFALILVFAALCTASPAPEPKKYKPEVKEPKTNSSLTNEEKLFLREVEAKFGIKSDVPVDEDKKSDKNTTKLPSKGDLPKLPFPAVIAIEIVNDTDSKGKGKRTIDANLGYGYRTNTGYSYSYFGNPQEKGKFVLYPYSQEDIPPANSNGQKNEYTKGGYTTASPNVEIQPSQAYELVPFKEEQTNSYEYKKPSVDFKSNYDNVKGLQSPPPPPYKQQQSPPSTLYTTYNGDHFSGLSGQFPAVPNYFVDSSQLLKSPQYQSAGINSDYIQSHGPQLEQKVVPVLVLRIPSSYLKNPSAELYANLPQNYPISQYLNNVNLQELVNQYFAKIGYSMAPQIMSYNHSPLSSSVSAPAVAAPATATASHYEPQHYSKPYVQPSYTQAHYSGVQYSAVQPVMAKYPSKYSVPQYYMAPAQTVYQQQPIQNQQYEYQYQYVSSPDAHQQYYVDNVHPEYHQISSQDAHGRTAAAVDQSTGQDEAAHIQYEESQEPASQQAQETPQSAHYRHQQLLSQQYETEAEYELPKEDPKNDAPTKVSVSTYSTPKPEYGASQEQQQYYSPKENVQKETIAIYPDSPKSQTIQGYQYDHQSGHSQNYYYQKQEDGDSASKTLVISENYPSQAHTIATVLPYHKTTPKPSKSMQSVNYVTPDPYSSKYQSRYNIMVPQTVLGGSTATNEKVSYVNSHSLPAHYFQSGSQLNFEEEYTNGLHQAPARSSQKAPSFPRNYHSQPKRMVKPENKAEGTPPSSSSPRKRNNKNDKNKSS